MQRNKIIEHVDGNKRTGTWKLTKDLKIKFFSQSLVNLLLITLIRKLIK